MIEPVVKRETFSHKPIVFGGKIRPHSANTKSKYGRYGDGGPQRRYYLRESTSFDDDLLGTKRLAKLHPESSRAKPASDVHKRQFLISHDMIRSFRVPRKDPSGQSIIITQRDYERLKESARVMTQAEKDDIFQKILREKQSQLVECQQRREAMKLVDKTRKTPPLNEFEQEAKEKSEELMNRVRLIRKERELEMRQLNTLILETKAAAVMQRQMSDKECIKKAFEDEDKRLDEQMEKEHLAAIERERADIAKTKEIRDAYGALLRQQIAASEEEKLLMEETKLVEQRIHLETMNKVYDDEKKLMENEQVRRAQFKDGLDEGMADMLHRMMADKWRDKVLEKEVKEYIEGKDAQMAATKEEKERIQKLKDAAKLRLMASYQQKLEADAEERDFREKRNIETNERFERQKEREARMEQLHKRNELKTMQVQQLALREQAIAIEMQQEREHFAKIIRAQQESIVKEEEKERQEALKRQQYGKFQLKQIQDREREQLQKRVGAFEERMALIKEQEQLNKEMKEIKEKKICEMKSKHPEIPDHFLEHVDRRALIPGKIILQPKTKAKPSFG